MFRWLVFGYSLGENTSIFNLLFDCVSESEIMGKLCYFFWFRDLAGDSQSVAIDFPGVLNPKSCAKWKFIWEMNPSALECRSLKTENCVWALIIAQLLYFEIVLSFPSLLH